MGKHECVGEKSKEINGEPGKKKEKINKGLHKNHPVLRTVYSYAPSPNIHAWVYMHRILKCRKKTTGRKRRVEQDSQFRTRRNLPP